MTTLSQRQKFTGAIGGIVHDAVLETGGITVDQDAYGSTLDRIYNVKGRANMHVEIENTNALKLGSS